MRRQAPIAVLALAIASLFALSASSASAALVRNHETSFGTFSGENPQALTVDQSNGDVYAIDTAADKVLRYDSAGLPKNFTCGTCSGNALTGFSFESFSSLAQVAVDNSGGPSDGNIYVTESSGFVVKVFASDGEPLGTLNGSGTQAGSFGGEPCGVAVDQSNGDLYIASYEHRIWRYTPSGSTVLEGDYSGAIATSINPCQIAVAQGSLYASAWGESASGPLRKYATTDFALGAPPSPSSTPIADKANAVATDPSNGDVYVDEGNQVSVFGSSGAPKYSFGLGKIGSGSAGVAIKAGGNAYASDPTSHQIDVFGPFSAPPPIVETEAATGVKQVKATLHGHLDPNGSLPINGCVFEWGTDTSYSEAPVPCAEGTSFNAAADVSAQLSGLTPGTTYHFRLHATTSAGGFDGEDQSFATTPASATPEVLTGKGTIVSSTSSQLKGTINPNGNPLTDCRFEYVDDIAIQTTGFSDLSSGGSMPCDQSPGSIAADFEDHEVSATITGLDPEQLYRFRLVATNANGAGNGEPGLVPGPPLVETTGSTYRTTTTARFDSRVSPHGAPTNYHFEYVTDAQFQANGFAGAVSTPDAPAAANEAQRIELVDSGHSDAEFKLGFGGFTTPDLFFAASAEEVQAALRALPSIGSPNVRVVVAGGGSTEFTHSFSVAFVGALAGTDVEQITASGVSPKPATVSAETQTPGGFGDLTSFVSAPVTGLQPATAYHYRLLAENAGGEIAGGEATLTTRASDAALTHGHFPGPSGSDRAWEQVSAVDAGGSSIFNTLGFSDDGNRAIYALAGGNPGSEIGSYDNQLFTERSASGWRSSLIHPTRAQAPGSSWTAPAGRSDLAQLVAVGVDPVAVTGDIWRLSPGAPAQKVFGASLSAFPFGKTLVADDGSRILALLRGSFDPDHPVVAPGPRDDGFYDVTSGDPHLVSLLPDGSVPTCGAGIEAVSKTRTLHWISADGSHVFFLSGGSGSCATQQLYVRDLEAETTAQISSGVSSAAFIRSTQDAAFFLTSSSLDPDDEGGKDVYRYDLADESLDCLTCVEGVTADVFGESANDVAVSDDGSHVYFQSPHRLLPGTAPTGIYRVDVASGDLAYVAPARGAPTAGDSPAFGNAISGDGSVFVFRSSNLGLDSLNGPQNGGMAQYYRYDDDDRSLVCVSCPADGTLPRGEVRVQLTGTSEGGVGPNLGPLTSAGNLVFPGPSALVPADQNTARPGQDPDVGIDIYEWRDGRLLLVTDGTTASQVDGNGTPQAPEVVGVTPSGRDVFFIQFAQLTPDAIDSFGRLYDARIGGGFDFPTPPPPCSLEACQGTPKGTPAAPRPASADPSGVGNVISSPARCRKGKVRRRGRCVAKKHKRAKHAHNRTNSNRRADR